MPHKGQREPKRQVVNLPRCGIFQAVETGLKEIPWSTQPPHPELDAEELAQRVAFNCFLCGRRLTKKRGSKQQDTGEDVFPKWMQADFDLAELKVPLNDGSQRKYSEILIPSCARCNNEFLSRFEERIARALRGGFERFSHLRKADIFLWCAKIYYGIVHLEVNPRDVRTKEALQPISSPSLLEDVRFLLRLLQGFRKRVMLFGYPSFFGNSISTPG